jgi:sugar/nucleoside kinase (ribokinase family)
MRWGLEAVVEKAGAAGCCLVTHGGQLALSAHPGPVSDPTGAGDALAGAFLAVLASASPPLGPGWVSGRVGEPMLRHALAMGMAAASLACSAEGCDALLKATPADLAARLAHWGIGAVNPRFA